MDFTHGGMSSSYISSTYFFHIYVYANFWLADAFCLFSKFIRWAVLMIVTFLSGIPGSMIFSHWEPFCMLRQWNIIKSATRDFQHIGLSLGYYMVPVVLLKESSTRAAQFQVDTPSWHTVSSLTFLGIPLISLVSEIITKMLGFGLPLVTAIKII